MKKSKVAGTSSLWKPEEIGASVEGTFNGFSSGKKQYKSPVLQLTTKSGEAGVPVSYQIAQALKPVIRDLKAGKDKFKFIYLGHPENAKGNAAKTRLIQTFLNGKEISQRGNFPTIANEEAETMIDKMLGK